jgi:tripartite-type tricarboxylate transporter receptor subunit TctC
MGQGNPGRRRGEHLNPSMRGAAVVYLTAVMGAAIAAEYPGKPIRIVTGSAPGGGSDYVARTLAEKLNERFGQPVLVDNRAGAGGAIGTDIVAKAAPDGYTMLVSTGSAIAVNPALHPLPYDTLRDLAPVTMVSRVPLVLAVNPSLPAKSVAELIQIAKSRPGQISYASSGIGAMSHLSMELFKNMARVDLVHVPYRGSAPAAIELISGQVQAAFNNLIPTLPHLKSGRLRALAVSGPVRSPVLPDVPTVAASGLPGYESMQWYGVMLPAHTPKPVSALLYRELMGILQQPVVRSRLTDEGGDVVGSTPEQFTAYIKIELAKWSKVAKEANIRAE